MSIKRYISRKLKMIKFINIESNPNSPYLVLKEKYMQAQNAGQKNIEAISISSFNAHKNEVNSRFVNLKFIDRDKFIFFTNYESPKSIEFKSHHQISALIFWPSINTQIRIKAKIKKTSRDFNTEYFVSRNINKNALAISSNQSKKISSYDEILKKYHKVHASKDLLKCPDYWGGYVFYPYEIEFWEGEKSRLNKRNAYYLIDHKWEHSILEP